MKIVADMNIDLSDLAKGITTNELLKPNRDDDLFLEPSSVEDELLKQPLPMSSNGSIACLCRDFLQGAWGSVNEREIEIKQIR